MKQVYHTEEIPHLWANQAQESARNAQGNLFFDNGIIFSYGQHFPIAKHITNKAGDKAILLTTNTYGITTARHINRVRQAIKHGTLIIPTHDVTARPGKTLLDDIQSRIDEARLKAKRARSSTEFYLAECSNLCKLFDKTAKFLCSSRVATIPTDDDIQAKIKAQRAVSKLNAEAERKAKAERLKEYEAAVADWKRGIHVHIPFDLRKTDLMRIEGDEAVTTRGARVPMKHVQRIVPLIIGMVRDGRTYKANGHTIHVGEYEVDELTDDGTLVVGCHRFAKEEVLRIGALFATTFPGLHLN